MASTSPIFLQMALSGTAVSVANTCTIPLDVIKVRMQLQNATAMENGMRIGLIETATRIASTEGPSAFFRGLGPALARGVFYGGTRLGLYGPIRDALLSSSPGPSSSALSLLGGAGTSNRGGEASTSSPSSSTPSSSGSSSFGAGLAAGCLSGCAAAALTNPIDLVKTRLQAPLSAHLSDRRHRSRPPSALETARAVASSSPRGYLALWAGVGPSAARAAVQTASQCAAYDTAKAAWRSATGAGDGPATHLAASAATGLVTTTCTAPIDVVKTKMMVETAAAAAAKAEVEFEAGVGAKRGDRRDHHHRRHRQNPTPWSVARDLVRAEGPSALLKGWTAQYLRLGPQSVITFLVLERLRKLFELPPL